MTLLRFQEPRLDEVMHENGHLDIGGKIEGVAMGLWRDMEKIFGRRGHWGRRGHMESPYLSCL